MDEWAVTVAADTGITISADSTVTPENGTKNIKIDLAIPDSTTPVIRGIFWRSLSGRYYFLA